MNKSIWFDFETWSQGWLGDYAFHVARQTGGKYGWCVWRSPFRLGAAGEASGDGADNLEEAKAYAEIDAEALAKRDEEEAKP